MCISSGMAKNRELKLSGHIKGKTTLTKKGTMRIVPLIIILHNTTTEANAIMMIISGNVALKVSAESPKPFLGCC